MRTSAKVAAATAAVGASCVAYGTFIESADYRVRRVDVPVLESGSEPIRVLHFSDTHLLSWQTRRVEFLSTLAGLEPDLVIATGDFLSSPDAASTLVDTLGRLLDVPGAFVFGSNDYSGPSVRNPLAYIGRSTRRDEPEARTMRPDELSDALSARGWVNVMERRATIEVRSQRFEIRGTGDAHENRDDYSRVAGPAEPGTIPLGVSHAPYRRILDAMADDGVRAVFCGHTHGGQVRMPVVGALTSNCDLPPDLARGVHLHESPTGASTWVNVSAGVGMSPYAPFRFLCPPEVTLMTLVAPGEGACSPASGLD